MAEYDIHTEVQAAVALDSIVIGSNTDTDGNFIDLAGFDAVEFILNVGLLTDGAYDLVVLHATSIAGANAEVVPAGDLIGVPGQLTVDDTVSRVGYIGGTLSAGNYVKRQFVQMRVTSTSVTTGATATGLAILGHPHSAPVADQ